MARAVLGSADAPVGLTPKELVWRKNKARLYRYVRSEPATHQTPIFLVLPLINRAYILDLRPGASFVEFLLSEGFDVFLIDWGTPGDEDQSLDVTTLVTRYLPRAAKAIQRATGTDQMTVLGYCIGGILATCFAALHPEITRNLVLLTAPLDFSDAGQFGRMTARGIFPVEQLTDTFPTVPAQLPDIGTKLLNPVASYVGTYRQLWEKLGVENFDVQGWQAMYRWVNDSVPFAGAAFRQWIVEFYQENRLARGHARDGGPAGPPGGHPLPGPQHRGESRPDRAAHDDEHRHRPRRQRRRVGDRHRGRSRRDRGRPIGQPEPVAEGRSLAQRARLSDSTRWARSPAARRARSGG